MFNRIRRYSLRDKDSIRKLCLDNYEIENREDTDTLASILLMHCDCYIDKMPETCFVAVDEKDEVIGYCLCAPDFEEYNKVYSEEYLTEAVSYGVKNYIDAKMNLMNYAMYKSMYPAHIIINVEDCYRRKGIGTKLMEIIKKELKAKDIHAVMTVCAEGNEGVIAFLEGCGFKRQLATKLGAIYAVDFNKNEND